jgi:hypothetical protein
MHPVGQTDQVRHQTSYFLTTQYFQSVSTLLLNVIIGLTTYDHLKNNWITALNCAIISVSKVVRRQAYL